jgi:Na+-transporting NADH:ubiquinone oxidoreductase subunit A
MAHIVIKQGLDLPIAGGVTGETTGTVVDLPQPKTVAYRPGEFLGLKPKMAAKVGDSVKIGSVLFTHKDYPLVKFLSPVAGTFKEIRRAERRRITDIVVEANGEDAEQFTAFDDAGIDNITRAEAIEAICLGGMWPTLRTRPLDLIPNPEATPQWILIGAFETGPLQPTIDTLLSAEDAIHFAAGVSALKAVANGALVMATAHGSNHAALKASGVTTHTFSGRHPAGDMGVQVNHIAPPKAGGQVWTIRAWDVALIGQLLRTGTFPTQRIYASVGVGAVTPRFVRTTLGAPIAHITGETIDAPTRTILGSVLTGKAVDADRWAGFAIRAIHTLPETVESRIFGWTTPNTDEFSTWRTFLSGMFGTKKKYDMRPGIWGGFRALVPMGAYQKVIATPDIMPDFLFRAMYAGDLQDSIRLGLLDITREEAALCTYVCACKSQIDVLLDDVLELYIKES